jgi:hypothetical protein
VDIDWVPPLGTIFGSKIIVATGAHHTIRLEPCADRSTPEPPWREAESTTRGENPRK